MYELPSLRTEMLDDCAAAQGADTVPEPLPPRTAEAEQQQPREQLEQPEQPEQPDARDQRLAAFNMPRVQPSLSSSGVASQQMQFRPVLSRVTDMV